MAKDIITKLREEMRKVQDLKRFEHTLGVTYTAACLAMCYNENIQDAEIAGLLHDCAKCLPNEKKIHICKKNHVEINFAESKNPFLLHAKAGAILAEKEYGITDQNILNAVRYHTTGRPGMSLLEKIVFIADYIEPGRTHSVYLPEIRKMAFADLDAALKRILSDTLEHLKTSENEIDPMTRETYEYYCYEK
ncbi:MAG: bis(5'-nucleosyl)-tetraphosphatase (symmetrical) YqeK [Lachnospiraceae bacterium]